MDEKRVRQIVREEIRFSHNTTPNDDAKELQSMVELCRTHMAKRISELPPLRLYGHRCHSAENQSFSQEVHDMAKADRKYEWVTEATLASIRAGNELHIRDIVQDALDAYDLMAKNVETIPPKQDGFCTATSE